MSDETSAVAAANDAFYAAFSTGDSDAMGALWAHGTYVSCDHPGQPTLHGRDEVMASWTRILDRGGAPGVHARAVRVALDGDVATVRCHEVIDAAAMHAVNTFVREDGTWRMTGHRAGFDGKS